MKKKTREQDENIWNAPNIITAFRVLFTIIIFYFIFAGFSLGLIVSFFVVAMLTDFLDGQIARRFHMTTEFGRKFDVVADRFLLIGTVIALLVSSFTNQMLTQGQLYQIFLILSREIIAFPFALLVWLAHKPLVHVRFVGKLTTFLQGFAFPSILLSKDFAIFSYAPYLTAVTCFVGIVSGVIFIKDMMMDSRQ